MTSVLKPLNVVARINRDVERSLLRARNGVRYATTKANVGATPRDVVWRRDRAELWRYRSATPIRYQPPVVIVHSLVSRSYILDLRPGSSAVEFLLGRGHDVYMLDWGVADERDADNTLATYVDEYLPRAVAAVRRQSEADEVTLAGYCLGGTFASLYSAGPDAPVRNLILMASPVDYSAMGAMIAAVREGRLEPRRTRRRNRERPCGRALQRLLHAGADEASHSIRNAAREPVERRVRRGLPGDVTVVT